MMSVDQDKNKNQVAGTGIQLTKNMVRDEDYSTELLSGINSDLLYTAGMLLGNESESISDMNLSILYLKRAKDLTGSDSGVSYTTILAGLVRVLSSCFKRWGDLDKLHEAIENQKQILVLTPEGHLEIPKHLNNLGSLLWSCFGQTGDLTQLEEAIKNTEQALLLTDDMDPNKSRYFSSLGNSFESYFYRTGNFDDLKKAIKNKQQAVMLTPDDHPQKPGRLSNLGISLQSLFGQTANIDDLKEAIKNQQQAVLSTPNGHPSKSKFFHNLGNSLHECFVQTGDLNDLNEAIRNQEQAVLLTPDGHPTKSMCFNNLGTFFGSLFDRTGSPSDLAKAIENQQQALLLIPDNHPIKPVYLNNLGILFRNQFSQTGNLNDLDEAIKNQQQAVLIIPHGHPKKTLYLNNLGASFQSRYYHTNDLDDLEEAIRNKQQSVSLTLDGDASKSKYLSNLGISFASRFRRSRNLVDAKEAIKLQQQALQLVSDSHSDKPAYFSSLGLSFQNLFNVTGNLSDIEEAIKNAQQAVLLVPDIHLSRAGYLNNLCIVFCACFAQTKNFNDIKEAIQNARQAQLLLPDGHPDKSRFLFNLGCCLVNQLGVTHNAQDLEEAIKSFQKSATSKVGSPSNWFNAAQMWASLASLNNLSSAKEAYQLGISIIPKIAWIGEKITSHQVQLKKYGSFSREAAAFALKDKRPDLALEWLEQGCSIIWNQLLNLRTPIENISEKYPAISTEFLQISHQLYNAGIQEQIPDESNKDKISIEKKIQRHHFLAERWNSLVADIQSLPGFENFLLPKKISALIQAAVSGYIVVINTHKSHCDAIILDSNGQKIKHIPLDNLKYADLENMQKGLKKDLQNHKIARRDMRMGRIYPTKSKNTLLPLDSILSDMYTKIVLPILSGLDLITEISDTYELPRIWWCPTGPLTFLPLHAAGLEIDGKIEETSKYVVSSYIPTINALLEARLSKSKLVKQFFGIGMANTPGMASLPGVKTEIQDIYNIFETRSDWKIECFSNETVIKEKVISGIKQSSWVHLACHAGQDLSRPIDSGLHLYDGRLRIMDIVAEPLPNADLAFLSACETATGDADISDEAIHITAAMLGAGYRGVVGTMWAIPDNAGPIIAKNFYKNIFARGEMDSTLAAYALHDAIRELKKIEKSPYSWVPFVHYGI